MNGRHFICGTALLLPLALAGCGGLHTEATALGLANPAAVPAEEQLPPDQAYALGREAEAAQRYAEAERLYIVAANGGNMDARVTLGSMYLAGRGVDRDYAGALYWLEPAARAGNAEAQARVGLIYDVGGIGVTRSDEDALMWYERAAAQGHANAQYRAGRLLVQSVLGHENPARAMQLFRAAAAQNHPQAITAVGIMYLQGRGVTSDPREAVSWLRRGANAGDPNAMVVLGRLYWEGSVVPKNIPEGRRWLEQAASLGSEEAQHELALPPG